MPDKLSPEQRHRNMSAIRSKNTRPEMAVRRFLHAHGYRYRLHVKNVPTTPDIVLRRLHTVILVNGCFWHGHKLALPEVKGLDSERVKVLSEDGILSVENSVCCKIPHTNRVFWLSKILRNRERDERDGKELRRLGWNVIRIWECELKPARREETLQGLLLTLSRIELQLAERKSLRAHEIRPYELVDDEGGRMVADDSKIVK